MSSAGSFMFVLHYWRNPRVSQQTAGQDHTDDTYQFQRLSSGDSRPRP